MVARAGLVRSLVRMRQVFRCAKPCSTGGAAGGFQVLDDVVVAGGGDVVGAPGPRGGDPDQASAFVGEREEVQAVALVLPRMCAVRRSLFEWR